MKRLHLALCAVLLVGTSACLHVSQDPWLATDKAMHFGAGVVIAIGAGPVAGCAAGGAKELHDLTGRGTASWRDLVATCAGAALAAAVIDAVSGRDDR